MSIYIHKCQGKPITLFKLEPGLNGFLIRHIRRAYKLFYVQEGCRALLIMALKEYLVIQAREMMSMMLLRLPQSHSRLGS